VSNSNPVRGYILEKNLGSGEVVPEPVALSAGVGRSTSAGTVPRCEIRNFHMWLPVTEILNGFIRDYDATGVGTVIETPGYTAGYFSETGPLMTALYAAFNSCDTGPQVWFDPLDGTTDSQNLHGALVGLLYNYRLKSTYTNQIYIPPVGPTGIQSGVTTDLYLPCMAIGPDKSQFSSPRIVYDTTITSVDPNSTEYNTHITVNLNTGFAVDIPVMTVPEMKTATGGYLRAGLSNAGYQFPPQGSLGPGAGFLIKIIYGNDGQWYVADFKEQLLEENLFLSQTTTSFNDRDETEWPVVSYFRPGFVGVSSVDIYNDYGLAVSHMRLSDCVDPQGATRLSSKLFHGNRHHSYGVSITGNVDYYNTLISEYPNRFPGSGTSDSKLDATPYSALTGTHHLGSDPSEIQIKDMCSSVSKPGVLRSAFTIPARTHSVPSSLLIGNKESLLSNVVEPSQHSDKDMTMGLTGTIPRNVWSRSTLTRDNTVGGDIFFIKEFSNTINGFEIDVYENEEPSRYVARCASHVDTGYIAQSSGISGCLTAGSLIRFGSVNLFGGAQWIKTTL